MAKPSNRPNNFIISKYERASYYFEMFLRIVV